MKELAKNDIFDVEIDGYSSDGSGVAHIDGEAVFIPGAIMGERCRVKILKVGKNAAWGKAEEILTASPHRVAPDCGFFPKCGGCALRHMDYSEELRFKRRRVEDALRRIGGTDVPVADVIGADSPDFYRNKVQFPAAAPDKLGFFRRRSHDVISVDNCRLQPAAAGEIRAAVLAWVRENGVTCYDEGTGRGWLRHLYVRTARNGDAAACLVATGEKVKNPASLVEKIRAAYPATVGIVLNVNRRGDNVILGDEYVTLWGSDVLCDTLCGYEFSLSVPSFYQVNPPQAERLYEKALELAALTGRETVLDLYCGIGTISLCLARRAGRVYGVEVVPEAVQNARDNARRNGVNNAEFFCADAGEASARLERDGVRPDVVCVDPPRKGLAPDVVETIARMAPERIVYVSCDPGTLARDVKLFAGHGYAARSATPVDMFPRTEHVETVVLMTRGEVYE